MPTYLVIRRRSGPEWDARHSIREQQGWSEHAAFMDKLTEDGVIVFGGPLESDDRVVFAVEADSTDEVRAKLADDPWSDSHLVLSEVVPWSTWLDSRELR
jgi:uncharacterized protein YciI